MAKFDLVAKNGIPLSLLNARITSKTFKRWMILNSFAKKILILLTCVLHQITKLKYTWID